MKHSDLDTCWTMVGRAVAGDRDAHAEFAQRYLGVVRAFLAARWKGGPTIHQLEDAVQEVFLDLLRSDGALARFQPERSPSFRAFLFGVTRKVALRHEERAAREWHRRGEAIALESLAIDEPSLSRAFDREWARALLRRARQRHEVMARSDGPAAERRVELLKLRFGEGMPIRDIAKLWEIDPAKLHHDYAKARDEFKAALRAEVAFHYNGTPADVERECIQLLELLA